RVGEPTTLLEHRLQDTLVTLTEVCQERAGGDIEETPTAVVDDMDAVSGDDRGHLGRNRLREEEVLGASARRTARAAHDCAPRDPVGVRTPFRLDVQSGRSTISSAPSSDLDDKHICGERPRRFGRSGTLPLVARTWHNMVIVSRINRCQRA